jgi:peptidoglycan hydrolase CwlO-like protein
MENRISGLDDEVHVIEKSYEDKEKRINKCRWNMQKL